MRFWRRFGEENEREEHIGRMHRTIPELIAILRGIETARESGMVIMTLFNRDMMREGGS
jgi:hypothetical protein